MKDEDIGLRRLRAIIGYGCSDDVNIRQTSNGFTKALHSDGSPSVLQDQTSISKGTGVRMGIQFNSDMTVLIGGISRVK